MARLAAAIAGALALAVTGGARAAVPVDFTDELVASVGLPTALAFTPDGRMLVTTQGGSLRLVQNGALLPTVALDLSAKVCSNSERGLLGVALDEDFVNNGLIYLYYTFKKNGVCDGTAVNRVSRFVLSSANVVSPASEVILLDNIPSPAGIHNGGDLAVGKDGHLYVTVGDGGCDYAGGGCAGQNDAARDRHVLVGKILRITRAGGIPPGNPFVGLGTARCALTGSTTPGLICQETFAWGLRNPFRFAFDQNAPGVRFYINDVGQASWEEIDLGQAGADYGWNLREGHCSNGSTTDCPPPPAGLTDPIYDYPRSSGCTSITGGAFTRAGAWPAPNDGAYFFADYICGMIFRLDATGPGTFERTPFANGLGAGSAVHLAFGPTGTGGEALFYTTYANGGEVRRIGYVGTTCMGLPASPGLAGTNGADTLTGTPGNDVIVGLGGNDVIDGRGGDDRVCAGEGIDRVTYAQAPAGVTVDLGRGTASGWGNDALQAVENVTGSELPDVLIGSTLANTLSGLGGEDQLRSAAGNDVLLGGLGNDFLRDAAGDDVVDGEGGVDTLDYSIAPGPVSVNLFTPPFGASGWGSESLASIENVNGSPYADVLVGSTEANVLSGLGGADQLRSAAGNDVLLGGPGNDFLRDAAGNDVVNGEGDLDTVDYSIAPAGVVVDLSLSRSTGWGSDSLTLVENVTGSPYRDVIVGSDVGNVLRGEAGNDDLDGRFGFDVCVQGPGTGTILNCEA